MIDVPKSNYYYIFIYFLDIFSEDNLNYLLLKSSKYKGYGFYKRDKKIKEEKQIRILEEKRVRNNLKLDYYQKKNLKDMEKS